MTLPQNSPTMVGPYELLRVLGDGAAATVFLARHGALAREVALKEISPLAPEHVARFVDGVRPACSLLHQNIAVTHEAFVHAGAAYVAQEYLPGGPLRGERLTSAQVAGVLEGVLAALDHAHARGIVHGGIRLENVRVSEAGVAKLTDFGIAGMLAVLAPRRRTLVRPPHIAHEQDLTGVPSERGDLYSVGVLARALGLPSDARLARWTERMGAREPANRPASAAEAWHELEEIVVEIEQPQWRRRAALDVRPAPRMVEPEPAPEPAPAPPEPPRGRRALYGAVAAAAGLAVAGGAYVALQPAPEPILPVRPVEAKIRTLVSAQTPVDGVRCPGDVPDRAGVRFACDVALARTDQRWVAIVHHGADGRNEIQLRLR